MKYHLGALGKAALAYHSVSPDLRILSQKLRFISKKKITSWVAPSVKVVRSISENTGSLSFP